MFELHEHYRLKTRSAKLTRVLHDIIGALAKNENLTKLETLNLPIHRDNVQSKEFSRLLEVCKLKHLSLVGYANDKRNSSKLQIIEPIDDVTNFCLISKVTTLETLETRGK